jgi:hypothetical protein
MRAARHLFVLVLVRLDRHRHALMHVPCMALTHQGFA